MTATNGFDAALGSDRGVGNRSTALTGAPDSADGRAELTWRVEHVSSEVTLAETVRLLRRYPVEDWPKQSVPALIRELDSSVGRGVAELAMARQRRAATELLFRTGVRYPYAASIVALRHKGKLHLLQETSHPSPRFAFSFKPKTRCGREVARQGVTVPHGLWNDQPHMRCSKCEQYDHETAYEFDITDTAEAWLPGWALDSLRARLSMTLMARLRNPEQALDGAAVARLLDDKFEQELLSTAMDVYDEEPHLTLQRAIGPRYYEQLCFAVWKAKRDRSNATERYLRAPAGMFEEHYRWVASHPDMTLDDCWQLIYHKLLAYAS